MTGKTGGQLYFDPQFLSSFVLQAHREGLQLSFHAIGDRAITMILDAYEAALRTFPRDDHRHRIEHCELLSVRTSKGLDVWECTWRCSPPLSISGEGGRACTARGWGLRE